MLDKAKRKVAETDFFLRELRGARDPDAFEFRFNALLNAGKNVVYSIRAQIYHTEAQRIGAPATSKAVKNAARAAYDSHFSAWRQSRTAADLDLFDVVQELRDIETHEKDAASSHISTVVERREPRSLPSDQHNVAIYAQYMATRALSSEITRFETTYSFDVDAQGRSDPEMQALFTRFEAAAPKTQLDIGQIYASLLRSLVEHFSANYT